MISIGQFAKMVQTSTRTLRFYESIGLITSSKRESNNYRTYDEKQIPEVMRIKELQSLGFTLDEIKTIIKVSHDDFKKQIIRKLEEVDRDLNELRHRKDKLENLLNISGKIELNQFLNQEERKQYMIALQNEIISNLKEKTTNFNENHLNYLKREKRYQTNEELDFIYALKSCIEFAKKNNIRTGPVRGSASSSLVNYAYGISYFDPLTFDLIPERLLTQEPNIHLDVEFERGQEFINYCQEINTNLKFGQIQAFKMPLLDILMNVEKRIGFQLREVNFNVESDSFLDSFRNGNIEKIFLFDMSEDSLIMKLESFVPGYEGLEKLKEYLISQPIINYRDLLNICSIWRPFSTVMIDRMEKYRNSKKCHNSFDQLSSKVREVLEPNFGMILYHEDLVKIISHYTNWDYKKSNRLRFHLNQKQISQNMQLKKQFPWPIKKIDDSLIEEFKENVSDSIFQLVCDEAPYTFCLPHLLSFSYFTNVTAFLKTYHSSIYIEEIDKWESCHSYRWDDIGIKIDGISLLQT